MSKRWLQTHSALKNPDPILLQVFRLTRKLRNGSLNSTQPLINTFVHLPVV